MSFPRIYTTPQEMTAIRLRLTEHEWYARSFANLRAPVDELLRHGIKIPREKGFVFFETCPRDNGRLRQDPFNPHDHICVVCGVNYTEEVHHRAWVNFYHLYVAQRALDMGIVYQVTGDVAYADAIRHVLTDYARHYEDYPLVDCVLGPTRLFESTWIESVWLAALAGAADLAAETIPAAEWRLLRDGLFLPSTTVIRDYDEGRNNRQAMNNVAIGLTGVLFEEDELVHYALYGPHGWSYHLEHSVLEDGLWYEGNNYHFATLPAMANLAEAMSRNGQDLYAVEIGGRCFKMMFDAPIVPLYPDLAFPARKDSAFGITVGQRWHAGMFELGFRRYGDPAYARLLREMYQRSGDDPAGMRWASGLIDVNDPCPADRERLDWRGFLNAAPDLDVAAGMPVTTSVNMIGTGMGILRQDGGRTYAAIDYGHYGGGHGHPDRMQLHFYARGKRWCVDWGTGAYFFDHLRWYRSSIAHNTVVVDGKPHQPVEGMCRRFGATPVAQVISASVEEVAPGVRFERTAVLLSPDLLLDLFTVEADRTHRLDWALHPYGDAVDLIGINAPTKATEIHGEHYEWLQEARSAPADEGWQAHFRDGGNTLVTHMLGEAGTEVFTAKAHGAPPEIPKLFPVLIARRTAARTTFCTLLEHRAGNQAVVRCFRSVAEGAYEIALVDGSRICCDYDSTTAGVGVTRYGSNGALVEASGFGVSDIAGVLAADFPLDEVYLRIAGDSAHVTAPERFGRIRVEAPGIARVAVNGAPAAPGSEVRQRREAWSWLDSNRWRQGVSNTIDLKLANFRDEALTGNLDLNLPEGCVLVDPTPTAAVAPGAVASYPIQCVPGSASGYLAVGLTGDRLAVTSIPPIEVESWFPNRCGATLRTQIVNRSGEPREITLAVGEQTRVVEIDQEATLDLPIDWQEAAEGLVVRVSCGEYVASHDLQPSVAFVGRDSDVAEARQVRRGERRWGGPADLSARYRVDAEGDGLRLHVAVTDDTLASSGSVEKHFDYDSVQVYFDPRGDQDRTNDDLTGIYGLVLIPGSAAGEPPRIVPIGPAPSTLVSEEMIGPSLEGVALRSHLRPDGYDLDLIVPFDRIGSRPRAGDKLGFDLILNDNDGTFRRAQQMVWTGAGESRIWLRQDYHSPQRFGMLVW